MKVTLKQLYSSGYVQMDERFYFFQFEGKIGANGSIIPVGLNASFPREFSMKSVGGGSGNSGIINSSGGDAKWGWTVSAKRRQLLQQVKAVNNVSNGVVVKREFSQLENETEAPINTEMTDDQKQQNLSGKVVKKIRNDENSNEAVAGIATQSQVSDNAPETDKKSSESSINPPSPIEPSPFFRPYYGSPTSWALDCMTFCHEDLYCRQNSNNDNDNGVDGNGGWVKYQSHISKSYQFKAWNFIINAKGESLSQIGQRYLNTVNTSNSHSNSAVASIASSPASTISPVTPPVNLVNTNHPVNNTPFVFIDKPSRIPLKPLIKGKSPTSMSPSSSISPITISPSLSTPINPNNLNAVASPSNSITPTTATIKSPISSVASSPSTATSLISPPQSFSINYAPIAPSSSYRPLPMIRPNQMLPMVQNLNKTSMMSNSTTSTVISRPVSSNIGNPLMGNPLKFPSLNINLSGRYRPPPSHIMTTHPLLKLNPVPPPPSQQKIINNSNDGIFKRMPRISDRVLLEKALSHDVKISSAALGGNRKPSSESSRSSAVKFRNSSPVAFLDGDVFPSFYLDATPASNNVPIAFDICTICSCFDPNSRVLICTLCGEVSHLECEAKKWKKNSKFLKGLSASEKVQNLIIGSGGFFDHQEELLLSYAFGWKCSNCKVCEKCEEGDGTTRKDEHLINCSNCSRNFHPSCCFPFLHSAVEVDFDRFLCESCIECQSCEKVSSSHWRSSASQEALTSGIEKLFQKGSKDTLFPPWSTDFAICSDCQWSRNKGHICPICEKVYNVADYEVAMLQCEECNLWIHLDCDKVVNSIFGAYEALSYEEEGVKKEVEDVSMEVEKVKDVEMEGNEVDDMAIEGKDAEDVRKDEVTIEGEVEMKETSVDNTLHSPTTTFASLPLSFTYNCPKCRNQKELKDDSSLRENLLKFVDFLAERKKITLNYASEIGNSIVKDIINSVFDKIKVDNTIVPKSINSNEQVTKRLPITNLNSVGPFLKSYLGSLMTPIRNGEEFERKKGFSPAHLQCTLCHRHLTIMFPIVPVNSREHASTEYAHFACLRTILVLLLEDGRKGGDEESGTREMLATVLDFVNSKCKCQRCHLMGATVLNGENFAFNLLDLLPQQPEGDVIRGGRKRSSSASKSSLKKPCKNISEDERRNAMNCLVHLCCCTLEEKKRRFPPIDSPNSFMYIPNQVAIPKSFSLPRHNTVVRIGNCHILSIGSFYHGDVEEEQSVKVEEKESSSLYTPTPMQKTLAPVGFKSIRSYWSYVRGIGQRTLYFCEIVRVKYDGTGDQTPLTVLVNKKETKLSTPKDKKFVLFKITALDDASNPILAFTIESAVSVLFDRLRHHYQRQIKRENLWAKEDEFKAHLGIKSNRNAGCSSSRKKTARSKRENFFFRDGVFARTSSRSALAVDLSFGKFFFGLHGTGQALVEGLDYCLEHVNENSLDYQFEYVPTRILEERSNPFKIMLRGPPTCARLRLYDEVGKRKSKLYNAKVWASSSNESSETVISSDANLLNSLSAAEVSPEDSSDLVASAGNTASNIVKITSQYRMIRSNKPAVKVKPSQIQGAGLYAQTRYMPNDLVIEYAGHLVGQKVADALEIRYELAGIGCYLFKIEEDRIVDATMMGNQARFINHSCAPNCYAKIVNVSAGTACSTASGANSSSASASVSASSSSTPFEGRVLIFANRVIEPGTELTYDYQFQLEDDDDRKIKCACGAAECRGYMN